MCGSCGQPVRVVCPYHVLNMMADVQRAVISSTGTSSCQKRQTPRHAYVHCNSDADGRLTGVFWATEEQKQEALRFSNVIAMDTTFLTTLSYSTRQSYRL